jgi:hypothetical protein
MIQSFFAISNLQSQISDLRFQIEIFVEPGALAREAGGMAASATRRCFVI